ncbi:MAG: ABC transporter ATP-binding protein [Gemmatimonadetes bacterium]|nr:ABC transporter ATP-binding protein [Gemmatimonadota bacterium]NNL31564.1 ABC transporter ATP-binding protein [Gemmatimonadota bacterium]
MHELRAILPYFRPYTEALIGGLVCVVFANVFQILGPWFMKLAIDGMGDPDVTMGPITLYAAMIVVVAFVGGVFRFGMRQLLNGVSRRIETDLRDDFFRHLLRLDARFYGSTRTGDLMSRATNDTLAVRMAAGPAIMYTVNTVASFVFALGFMLWISPRLTLFALVPLVVLPPIVLGFGRIIHQRFEEIQEQFSSLSTFVQESLTGVRLVRAYTQESEQARQFDGYNADYRSRNMGLVLRAGAFHPVLSIVSGTAMVLVTWLGAVEVMENRMSLGDFVAFGFYLTLLIWPMIALGWVVNLYQRGAASMGRLNRIFETEPDIDLPDEPAPIAGARGAITFENVSFRYPDTERLVLESIDFTVEAGQTVAIVGPTGAGKSTLLALLTRLYDPSEGRILLDGTSLDLFDPAELRRRIGMVPQDSFLFSNTIAGNIGLGLDEEDLDAGAGLNPEGGRDIATAVRRSAEIAQLHEQIEDFPKGYDTILGERGINLSGGQKQRATLARALARNPLILILDDALSAVDTHTESAILEDLREVAVRRTVFIVSHRVSAVMNADKVLVLENGRIVQEGAHDELIAQEGTYERLLRRQLLEEDLEATPAGAVGD